MLHYKDVCIYKYGKITTLSKHSDLSLQTKQRQEVNTLNPKPQAQRTVVFHFYYGFYQRI